MSSGYFGQSDQMEHRDQGAEFRTIAGKSDIIFDKEREMGRALGEDQRGLAKDWAQDALDLYPQLAAAERQATRMQRAGDLTDLKSMGGRYRDALNSFNPGWQKSLELLNKEAETSGAASPLLGELTGLARSGVAHAGDLGPSALRSELVRQAQSDLAAGRSMTPEELRDVQQSARAAYADRGLTESNPAMIAEVLARDRYGREREAQRRAFAGQTQQLAQSEDESLIRQGTQLGQFGQAVEGLNLGQEAQRTNTLSSINQTNQSAFAPVLGFFGRTNVSPTAGAQVMSSAPNIIGAGAQSMGPIMSYGQDLFNTNFNADAATRLNNANNMAAIHGAVIGAVGSIAGGAMGCWVAREIFDGEECPPLGTLKWLVFRDWMATRAPQWLFTRYCRHGVAFARWLRTPTRSVRAVRRLVRASMEAVLHLQIRRHRSEQDRRRHLLTAC